MAPEAREQSREPPDRRGVAERVLTDFGFAKKDYARLGWDELLDDMQEALSPQLNKIDGLLDALKPLAAIPIGAEIEKDRDLVLFKNAGKSITVGDVLEARAAIASAEGV